MAWIEKLSHHSLLLPAYAEGLANPPVAVSNMTPYRLWERMGLGRHVLLGSTVPPPASQIQAPYRRPGPAWSSSEPHYELDPANAVYTTWLRASKPNHGSQSQKKMAALLPNPLLQRHSAIRFSIIFDHLVHALSYACSAAAHH